MKGAVYFVFSLLLCLLAASPFIFSLCFNIYRIVLRHEAREALEMKESISVTIPVNELHWIDKESEVMIDGELFDVKKYTIQGDSVKLTGLYDKDETLIVHKLNSLRNEEDGSDAFTLVLFKWLGCFAADIKASNFIFQTGDNIHYLYSLFSDKLPLSFYKDEAPPPRLLLS